MCRSVLLLLLLLGMPACGVSDLSSDVQDPYAHMRWLESADPVKDFTLNKRRSTPQFKAVQWYARDIPGVGEIRYMMCFSPHATVETIDPTGDSLFGDDHIQLKKRAVDYASTYNRLLVDHLEEAGRAECGSTTNWAQGLDDINKYLRWPDGEQWGYALLSYERLQIGLRNFQRARSVGEKVCEILERHSVKRNFRVQFHDSTQEASTVDNGLQREYTYTCILGDSSADKSATPGSVLSWGE